MSASRTNEQKQKEEQNKLQSQPIHLPVRPIEPKKEVEQTEDEDTLNVQQADEEGKVKPEPTPDETMEYIFPFEFKNAKNPNEPGVQYGVQIPSHIMNDPEKAQGLYNAIRDLKEKQLANGGKLTADDIKDLNFSLGDANEPFSTEKQLKMFNDSNILDVMSQAIAKKYPDAKNAYEMPSEVAFDHSEQGVELQEFSPRNPHEERNKAAKMDQPFEGAHINPSKLMKNAPQLESKDDEHQHRSSSSPT